MSEEIECYDADAAQKTKLLFLSKRLSDVTKDLISLSEKDKKFVIERTDKLNAIGLVEIYNLLGEYME